mgnify:CR=1 FL=1
MRGHLEQVRAALPVALARLDALKIHGKLRLSRETDLGDKPVVKVSVKVNSEVDFATQDERAALAEVVAACRSARIYAEVVEAGRGERWAEARW